MAKLVEVYRNEKQKLTRRQVPLVVYDNIKMVMDLNGLGCLYGSSTVRAKDVDKFIETFNSLTSSEVQQAFLVDSKDFFSLLKETVPCVGCRRSVERLYDQLKKSGHPALEPLVIMSEGALTIQDEQLSWPRLVCNLLHEHSAKLTQLLQSQSRSKKSNRCIIHSLEYQRLIRPSWKEVWDVMRPQCKEEVLLIPAGSLMVTLENYLQKHRFCGDCRTKVLRAYWLLVEEPEPTREKGYIPALYSGIKRCLPDKHIHLPASTDYVSTLVARAQPDVLSSGERHAKTLEVAQGEIITCLGLVVYERLHRIQMRLKEEETTCQVLAAVAVDSLSRNFEVAVDSKRGITKLELLFKEITTKEENIKQQKKEQKKSKKKKRKDRKPVQDTKTKLEEDCSEITCPVGPCETEGLGTCNDATDNVPTDPEDKGKNEKLGKSCLCECTTHDCGYSSGNNNASLPSSPEGSEVACCDDFCNDEGVCSKVLTNTAQTSESPMPPNRRFTLSLEQMLEETTSSDEESFIPLEDVKEFQSRDNIPQQREELRQILRMRFAQLCIANNPNY